MCDSATLTRNGHFLNMKHIARIIPPNLWVALMIVWRTHVEGAHNNDKELNVYKRPNSIDYCTNGVCESGN
jgi:hypothetical protein